MSLDAFVGLALVVIVVAFVVDVETLATSVRSPGPLRSGQPYTRRKPSG